MIEQTGSMRTKPHFHQKKGVVWVTESSHTEQAMERLRWEEWDLYDRNVRRRGGDTSRVVA